MRCCGPNARNGSKVDAATPGGKRTLGGELAKTFVNGTNSASLMRVAHFHRVPLYGFENRASAGKHRIRAILPTDFLDFDGIPVVNSLGGATLRRRCAGVLGQTIVIECQHRTIDVARRVGRCGAGLSASCQC